MDCDGRSNGEKTSQEAESTTSSCHQVLASLIVPLETVSNLSFLAFRAAGETEKAESYLTALDQQVDRISVLLRGYFKKKKLNE